MEIKEALEIIDATIHGMQYLPTLTGVEPDAATKRLYCALKIIIEEYKKLSYENGALKIGMTMDHIQAMEEIKNNKKQ